MEDTAPGEMVTKMDDTAPGEMVTKKEGQETVEEAKTEAEKPVRVESLELKSIKNPPVEETKIKETYDNVPEEGVSKIDATLKMKSSVESKEIQEAALKEGQSTDLERGDFPREQEIEDMDVSEKLSQVDHVDEKKEKKEREEIKDQVHSVSQSEDVRPEERADMKISSADIVGTVCLSSSSASGEGCVDQRLDPDITESVVEKIPEKVEEDLEQSKNKILEGDLKELQGEGDLKESQGEGDLMESQCEGELEQSKNKILEGDLKEPQGEGDLKEPQGEGDLKEPQGEGDLKEPQGEGDLKEPQGEGDLKKPQGEGDLKKPQGEEEVVSMEVEESVANIRPGSSDLGDKSNSSSEKSESDLSCMSPSKTNSESSEILTKPLSSSSREHHAFKEPIKEQTHAEKKQSYEIKFEQFLHGKMSEPQTESELNDQQSDPKPGTSKSVKRKMFEIEESDSSSWYKPPKNGTDNDEGTPEAFDASKGLLHSAVSRLLPQEENSNSSMPDSITCGPASVVSNVEEISCLSYPEDISLNDESSNMSATDSFLVPSFGAKPDMNLFDESANLSAPNNKSFMRSDTPTSSVSESTSTTPKRVRRGTLAIAAEEASEHRQYVVFLFIFFTV